MDPGGEDGKGAADAPDPGGAAALAPSLAKGKPAEAPLFGAHDRHWVRHWVQRICREANVPEVCAHSIQGLHSNLAVDSGVTAHCVAAALGHESLKTTTESYIAPGAVAGARQRRVLSVLSGGGE